MRTCPRICSRTLWSAPPRPWRNTTSRKTLLPTSKRSLTRSTTPPGIALWEETSAAMSPMRPSISSTSTWGRWPFSSSSRAEAPTSPTTPY
ncbi:hypothetical protein AALO_G00065930 [Alosa alosa]|uniref:Uncharacterized protein n=1 Tax=Alosa alosa TaxID=278164 RepID=A0AAV6H4N0_9TELE|nr:hypothetical protein AALO_G00065930 [Alosa alosa]